MRSRRRVTLVEATAIAAWREWRSPRAGTGSGATHIAEVTGVGAPADAGRVAAARSAQTQGAAEQVGPSGGRRRGEGRATSLAEEVPRLR